MTAQWEQWIWLKGDPVSFTEVKTDGATKWVWLQFDAMNQRTKETDECLHI